MSFRLAVSGYPSRLIGIKLSVRDGHRVMIADESLVGPRKAARKSHILTDADRLQIVLESLEHGALVSKVARRNRVDPRELSRWRRSYRAGQLGVGSDPDTVPISELAGATQRIRDLERELGRMALENAMLLEAVEFAGLTTLRRGRAAAVKKHKK